MNENTAGSAAGIDLARLEQLARAADQGEGQHIYTHPCDSNNWRANANWHHAADPDTMLALIALARATPQPSADRAPSAGAGEMLARVIAACEAERVDAETTGEPGDAAYNMAINHCIEVIRALAPTAGDSATPQPVYATGGINDIADELEAEALNYEGDFADTVKGCAEALREIAATPQHSVAEQASEHEAFKAAMVAKHYVGSMFDYFLAEGEVTYHDPVANQMYDAWQAARAQPLASTAATDDLLNAFDPPRAALKREDWDAQTKRPKLSTAATQPEQADERLLYEAACAKLEIPGDWWAWQLWQARAALAIPASTAASEQQAGADERALFEQHIRDNTNAAYCDFRRKADYPDEYSNHIMATWRRIWCAAITHRATTAADQQDAAQARTGDDALDASLITITFRLFDQELPALVDHSTSYGGTWNSEWCVVIDHNGNMSMARFKASESEKVAIGNGNRKYAKWAPPGSWTNYRAWAYQSEVRVAIDAAQAAPATSGGKE